MINDTPYPLLLKKILSEMSFYESASDIEDLLKKALSLLMEKDGAQSCAVFVYDVKSDELVFRVGCAKGNLGNHYQYDDHRNPRRYSLEGNVIGKTFSDNTLKIKTNDPKDSNEPFGSEIFIPIIRGPERIGVLLLAYGDPQEYKKVDQSELKEAISLLGDILSEASILIDHINLSRGELLPIPKVIRGIKASQGIAHGRALPIWIDSSRKQDLKEKISQEKGSKEKERALFEASLLKSQKQLEELTEEVSLDDREMASMIFTAQLLMLNDPSFIDKIRDLIQQDLSAAKAVETIVDEFALLFSQMSEIRLAEKAQDVKDLGFRLISNLSSTQEESFSYRGKIILSRHIYPSDLFRLSLEGAAGVVLIGAAVTAHISILSRSLSIPVLITDDKSLLTIPEGTPLVLDVDGGKLYINPEDITRRAILDTRHKENEHKTYTLRGQTKDGVSVNVLANVNILRDAQEAVKQGAEGIGLYRSEFPFILKNDYLSEEQQFRIYHSIAESHRNKPLVFRTADIGGDKLLQGRIEVETNPFLGVRGIRFSLANRDFFHDQLRAMLRAGEGKDLRLLFPMVTDWEEIVRAREEVKYCINQLKENGIPHNNSPLIGAMIELPSAAISIEDIIEETDFISIGTNDLTMYLLAVDRTNENLSHLYRSHHPTVLKVLASIIKTAVEKGIDLSVCGDVASDPVMIPFLVGLGVRKLSVSPHLVEEVKRILMKQNLSEMSETAKEMLSIRKMSHMEDYRMEKES